MGGYEAADARAASIADFYPALAELLHTRPENIAWTASATDGYARALSTIAWKNGDVIVTTNNDYVSNQLAFFSLRERFGVQIIRAADLPTGGVDPADMERMIDLFRPILVAVTHIPTNSGLVQPIERIGQICRHYKILYLVDACQSAGQRILDVNAIGCDFLTATLRKYMRGPRGAGFMYASDRVLQPNQFMLLPDMIGADWTGIDSWKTNPTAKRFEYFEYSPAIKIGSAVATRYLLSQDQQWIQDRITHLGQVLRNRLSDIPDVRVLDHGTHLCGIVTAYHPAFQGYKIRDWLREQRVNTSVSTLNAAQIDFSRKGIDAALRLSVHYYNTEEELEQAVAFIDQFITWQI
jgi:selenocysteine lyase/cysteine desulfurase